MECTGTLDNDAPSGATLREINDTSHGNIDRADANASKL